MMETTTPQQIIAPDLLAAAQADAQASIATNGGPAGAPPQDTAMPAAPVDYKAQGVDAIEFAAALFFPISPRLEAVYTPEVRAKIAAPLGQIFEKYKIDLSVLGPELTLGIVLVPLIVPTIKALKLDHADAKKAAAETTATVRTAPDATTEKAAPTETASDLAQRFPGLNAAT